jgi:4-amino-4-deoxy-L-arabinose transferase-like glycosyltransferase
LSQDVVGDPAGSDQQLTSPTPAIRPQKWALAVIWTGGLLFFAGVALAATLHLAATYGSPVEQFWLTFPALDNRWLWGSLGLVAVAVGGLVLVVRLSRTSRESWLLPLGLTLVVVTRVVAIVLIHPPLISDWLKYYSLAESVASTGPQFSDVPTGYPIVAGLFFKVFGANVLVGELMNVFASVITGWLVFRLAGLLWSRRAAGLALYLYAVLIAPLLMVTLFCSEVVFGAGILAAVVALTEATRRSGTAAIVAALCCGALLGVSQYVRADAELVLPALLVLPFLVRLPARQAAKLSAACLAAFLLITGPVILWNQATYGTWSVATSNYGGWSLLVGTDPQNTGQYNVADIALVPADTTSRAFNDEATALALQRLEAHPGRMLELAVRKIVPMWGNEDYAAMWTLDQTSPDLDGVRSAIALTSQIMYAGVLVMAAMALWLERRRRPIVLTLVILVVAATAIAHTFIEVQPRYHFFIEPMFCILAGGWLAARFPKDSLGT